jgi:hypothetical protein
MDQPKYILKHKTRIKTNPVIDSTRGMLIAPKHLDVRRTNTVGVVCGIVGGHGGDVYFVAQLGDSCMAAYGWWEFELAPANNPCATCEGTGIDWKTSHDTSECTACQNCHGTAEDPGPKPPPISAYDHMRRNIEDIK